MANSVPYLLFTYSIDHLAQKDKVRFYYALKGRDGKAGVLSRKGVEQLGRTVLLVPADLAEEFRAFLRSWKCNFTERQLHVDPADLQP